MAMSWRREMREARKRRSFLFSLFLIESHQFVLLTLREPERKAMES